MEKGRSLCITTNGTRREVETVSRHTGHKKDDGMTQEERWMVRYEEVIDFIENNHRNPSKHRIEEHDMLNWA